MNLQVALPLKFIRLCKTGTANNPVCAPGDAATYRYGALANDDSLPVDYWLIGWLLCPPATGEPVRVLRVGRNGVACPGYFVSTDVMEVLSASEFLTMNSIYHWEELGIRPCEGIDA